MALSLIPVFNPPEAGVAPNSGEALGELFFDVETFAEEHELPSLSAFGDQRELPEDFDGPPEELDELMGPSTDWFPAEAGVKDLSELADGISASVEAGDAFEGAEDIVPELQAIVGSLKQAANVGASFRLTMV